MNKDPPFTEYKSKNLYDAPRDPRGFLFHRTYFESISSPRITRSGGPGCWSLYSEVVKKRY